MAAGGRLKVVRDKEVDIKINMRTNLSRRKTKAVDGHVLLLGSIRMDLCANRELIRHQLRLERQGRCEALHNRGRVKWNSGNGWFSMTDDQSCLH